jgi:hypothetical protein
MSGAAPRVPHALQPFGEGHILGSPKVLEARNMMTSNRVCLKIVHAQNGSDLRGNMVK